MEKLKLPGDKAADGTTPVPLKATVCWPPARGSSLIVSTPLRLPVVVGLKVTRIVQLLAAANVPPQLLVWLKSPVTPILLMFSCALPLFVSVIC